MTFNLHIKDANRRPGYTAVLLHLFAWGGFIFYEMATIFFLRGNFSGGWETLFYYLVYIGLFYCHACAVLPFAPPRARAAVWPVLLSLVLAEVAVAIALKFFID